MRNRKNSDRALDLEYHRLWRYTRAAHYVQSGSRRTILALSLATAIFLPLADMSSPSDSSGGGDDSGDGSSLSLTKIGPNNFAFNGDTYTHPDGGLVVEPVVTVLPNPVNVDVRVTAPNLHVLATPTIGRQWHRASFGGPGDIFWAIPEEDLTIVRRSDQSTVCDRYQCSASFGIESADYVVPNDATITFSNEILLLPLSNSANEVDRVDNRRIPTFSPSDLNCATVHLNMDFGETLACEFQPTDGGPDICIQIRRSDTIEEGTEVALDVRWDIEVNGICEYGMP